MTLDTTSKYAAESPLNSDGENDLPSSLTRSGKKIGGRQPGATNYSQDEVQCLLQLMQKFRPISTSQWEMLAVEYNRINNLKPSRTPDNLNKKFQSLAKSKKANEHGEYPPDVLLAKQIQVLLRTQHHAANVGGGSSASGGGGGGGGGATSGALSETDFDPNSISPPLLIASRGEPRDYAEEMMRAVASHSLSSQAAAVVAHTHNNNTLSQLSPVQVRVKPSVSTSSAVLNAQPGNGSGPNGSLSRGPLVSLHDVAVAFEEVLEQREATRAHTHTHAALSATHGDDGPSNADLMAVLQSLSQDVKTLCELLSRRERESDDDLVRVAKMPRL